MHFSLEWSIVFPCYLLCHDTISLPHFLCDMILNQYRLSHLLQIIHLADQWISSRVILTFNFFLRSYKIDPNISFPESNRTIVVVCAQSCPTVYNLEPTRLLCPWNFQARILEWVAFPTSGDHPHPGIEHQVSYISYIGRQILYLLSQDLSKQLEQWKAFNSFPGLFPKTMPELSPSSTENSWNFSSWHLYI